MQNDTIDVYLASGDVLSQYLAGAPVMANYVSFNSYITNGTHEDWKRSEVKLTIGIDKIVKTYLESVQICINGQ